MRQADDERQDLRMNNVEFKIVAEYARFPGATVEKDGVTFGYFAYHEERPVLLLYKKGTEEIAAELPFPEQKTGNFYGMKVKMQASQYEYNFREGDQVITDPYAKRVVGRRVFGELPSGDVHSLRGGFITKNYNWGEECAPQIPFEEVVMYHLHVRGFTMQKDSGVRKKGTFAGLREKIPYLKELGINQVKLMPVNEFADMAAQKRKEVGTAKPQKAAPAHAMEAQNAKTEYKMNYWGYGEGFYFAPKASYAASEDADAELKDMVKALHANGIEVILEFSFTDETDVGMITECLNYWAQEYHVDGFSVIARDGLSPELALLPLFKNKKLYCTWYPDYVVQRNLEKGYQIAASNDSFLVDCRRILKGEEQCLGAFGYQLCKNPSGMASVNYMTNHDGFTLQDLVSYDRKYNEANGEMGHDGSDYNFSWNCGAEGETKKREILKLRMKQRKNAYAMMLFSQGVPMLLAGDEFGNSQAGNNNPYCHDSELTWLDWNRKRSNKELMDFVREAIAYRKKHPTLHQKKELKGADTLSSGFPDVSFHGERAWYGDFDRATRHVGSMFSCRYAGEEGFIYIAWNFDWVPQQFALPVLNKKEKWYKVMDTSEKESFLPLEKQAVLAENKHFAVPPRTVIILEGR